MTHAESAARTPAGWYPDPQVAHLIRYWDGRNWTMHVHPAQQPQYGIQHTQRPTTVVVNTRGGGHVSGLTTGGHLFHLTMSILTFGLWLPVWVVIAFLGRRRIR